MELKKTPKADLEGKKSIFFEVGLVIALGVLFFAFEWKSENLTTKDIETVSSEGFEEEIIPITMNMAPPPPPPPPPPRLLDTYQIVEDNLDIDDDLEIIDVEDETQNEIVVDRVWGDAGGEDTGENDIFQIVEEVPAFQGDMNAWLKKNLNYPPIAQENGIQGRVYVQFVVEKDGSITDVNVVRSVDAALDREAVRVVKAMPKWKPGKQRNRPVRTQFTLPIVFQLQ